MDVSELREKNGTEREKLGTPDNNPPEIALHTTAPGKEVYVGADNPTPFIVDLPALGENDLLWQLQIPVGASDISITDSDGSPVNLQTDPNDATTLEGPTQSVPANGGHFVYHMTGVMPSILGRGGEWREGISPSRSPKTGHESLDSSGSCHPIALRHDADLPVSKQTILAAAPLGAAIVWPVAR